MLKLSWVPDCQSMQHAKKLVSNSSGLGEFLGVVNCVLNLPDGQVKFFGGIQIIDTVISAHENFLGAS